MENLQLSAATLDEVVVALLTNQVRDLRRTGLTDRAIARKLNLPRWIVRSIEESK